MTAPGWTTLLVRYGEIGVKGDEVRRRFERALQENLRTMLAREGVEAVVRRSWGRIYVDTPNADGALDILSRTFGVVSASPTRTTEADVDAVAQAAADLSRDLVPEGATFAIRSRRSGNHDFSSMDVARAAGAAVLEAHEGRGVSVDLDEPDVAIHVEVRQETAYLFERVVEGPGGLPLGTQGRVAALLETPDDVLAAWLLMKRGCTVEGLALEPVGDDLQAAVGVLARWAPGFTVRVLPPVEGTEGPGARRELLLEAARERTRSAKVEAAVVGDSLAESLSSTPLDARLDAPVFRPLVGFDDAERRDLAHRVGVAEAGLARGPRSFVTASRPLGDLVRAALADARAWRPAP